METAMTGTDLPIEVKSRLLDLARRLPDAARSDFVRNSASQLKNLALSHENTLVYGAVGFIVGELIDNFVTIPIPLTEAVACLTGDYASHALGAYGAVIGLQQDLQRNDLRKQVAEIIGSQMRIAINRA